MGTRWDVMWIVERVIAEIRRCGGEIARLFSERPGQIVIHINPADKARPVRIEIARLRLD